MFLWSRVARDRDLSICKKCRKSVWRCLTVWDVNFLNYKQRGWKFTPGSYLHVQFKWKEWVYITEAGLTYSWLLYSELFELHVEDAKLSYNCDKWESVRLIVDLKVVCDSECSLHVGFWCWKVYEDRFLWCKSMSDIRNRESSCLQDSWRTHCHSALPWTLELICR